MHAGAAAVANLVLLDQRHAAVRRLHARLCVPPQRVVPKHEAAATAALRGGARRRRRHHQQDAGAATVGDLTSLDEQCGGAARGDGGAAAAEERAALDARVAPLVELDADARRVGDRAAAQPHRRMRARRERRAAARAAVGAQLARREARARAAADEDARVAAAAHDAPVHHQLAAGEREHAARGAAAHLGLLERRARAAGEHDAGVAALDDGAADEARRRAATARDHRRRRLRPTARAQRAPLDDERAGAHLERRRRPRVAVAELPEREVGDARGTVAHERGVRHALDHRARPGAHERRAWWPRRSVASAR